MHVPTTQAGAENLVMLVLGRVILGLGIGLSQQSMPLFLTESAPFNLRGSMFIANQVQCRGSADICCWGLDWRVGAHQDGQCSTVSVSYDTISSCPHTIPTLSVPPAVQRHWELCRSDDQLQDEELLDQSG